MFDYQAIKRLATERRCKINDLIALAPKNDPFYCGTPADIRAAEWFASIWQMLKAQQGTHIRRLHYLLISQDSPVTGPDGLPYENTEGCWKLITEASKKARYLELVPAGAFVDRRNPEPKNYIPIYQDGVVDISSGSCLYMDRTLEYPSVRIEPPTALQRYHLEIWCEKSTINDILQPLCHKYEGVLVTSVGEQSITRLKGMIARAAGGRPTRIFYISDFDPAGQSMPVASSRKAEYFIRKGELGVDVKLFPIALTAAQCQKYRLPRTPIKDTETRRHGFQQRHGEGATELDALEALHPGVLRDLIDGEMKRYFDFELGQKIHEAKKKYRQALSLERDDILVHHQERIDALQAKYDDIFDILDDLESEHEEICSSIESDLRDNLPREFEWPEADLADEKPDPLFDSARGYEQQMAVYKSFQGKGEAATSPDAA